MKGLLVSAALGALVVASPAEAQLPISNVPSPSPVTKMARDSRLHRESKAAVTSEPPSAATVIGHNLLLGGANGLLRISSPAGALQIERFTMLGEMISDPTQQCLIDVGGETTIGTKNLGRPDGLERFEADIPACPFEFDILDGAVLVPGQFRACVFKDADCQASPSGLWGPDGASLLTDAKQTVQARTSAEAAMDVNYRTLEAGLSDRSRADALADEQSRFLSDREDICRKYSHEDSHRFCTIRLTEARAAFLKARTDELPKDAAKKPAPRPHRRKPAQ